MSFYDGMYKSFEDFLKSLPFSLELKYVKNRDAYFEIGSGHILLLKLDDNVNGFKASIITKDSCSVSNIPKYIYLFKEYGLPFLSFSVQSNLFRWSKYMDIEIKSLNESQVNEKFEKGLKRMIDDIESFALMFN